jgi:hypothetical protein
MDGGDISFTVGESARDILLLQTVVSPTKYSTAPGSQNFPGKL